MSELDSISFNTPLVECVPNISEGRDQSVIGAVVSEIEQAGARVLHVDTNSDANRTVLTIVGTPDVIERASYAMCEIVAETIDMSQHTGEHPRLGAVDVCPFIPLAQCTMEDCAGIARRVGRRVADRVAVPVFLYGYAASNSERVSLSSIRRGQYEGLEEKIQDDSWRPDYGPAIRHPRFGALTIGARDILIAYNVNLDSQDLEIAKKIAADVRKSNPHVKAIGWTMSEYNCVQVSMNLVSYRQFGLFQAFETCKQYARAYGVTLSGSELIGMLPLKALVDAGTELLGAGSEQSLAQAAVEGLGLESIAPFSLEQRVLEYAF